MIRPSWDQHFLNLAAVAGEMSPCCRRQVGTVLVRDKHVLSSGFNGPARGAPHRDADTCVRKDLPSGAQPDKVCCAHSEANAVALAAYHGHATKGATAYVTLLPCTTCARILINAGVERVVYAETYANAESFAVFEESGIAVETLHGADVVDGRAMHLITAKKTTAPANPDCVHGGDFQTCPWCVGARMAKMHEAPACKIHDPPPPGYAPCTRSAPHEGPCAHPVAASLSHRFDEEPGFEPECVGCGVRVSSPAAVMSCSKPKTIGACDTGCEKLNAGKHCGLER